MKPRSRQRRGFLILRFIYTTMKKTLSETNPNLASEWHPSKNLPLTPADITGGSSRKVWWKCQGGHEWQASVSNRTGINKTGCPFCSGKRVTDNTNLAALFPHLLDEWDFEKNNPSDPNTLMPYSHEKVWWKCKEGHEWKTGIAYRTKQNSGCPYCCGRVAGSDNSLAILHPELIKEWDHDKNGTLTPTTSDPGRL